MRGQVGKHDGPRRRNPDEALTKAQYDAFVAERGHPHSWSPQRSRLGVQGAIRRQQAAETWDGDGIDAFAAALEELEQE